jgi:hypothetical protein
MTAVFGYLQPDKYYHMDDTCPTTTGVGVGIAGKRSIGEYPGLAAALAAGHVTPCPVCCAPGKVAFAVKINDEVFRRTLTEREVRMIAAIGDAVKLGLNTQRGIAEIYGIHHINILPHLGNITQTPYVHMGLKKKTRRRDGVIHAKTLSYQLTLLGEAIYYDIKLRQERELRNKEQQRLKGEDPGECKKII